MNKEEKNAGGPIDDDALEQVSGGMRVQGDGRNMTQKSTVSLGGDTVGVVGACNVPGCGTIFNSNNGAVVGVDSAVDNKKY